MKDKFRENFFIALPAALITLFIIIAVSYGNNINAAPEQSYSFIQIIPYIIVLAGGIIGVNVFVVLLIGIVSGSVIMLSTGAIACSELISNMGSGASGMFETSMVAVLVSAICALIKNNGGFDYILGKIRKVFKGRKGGQFGVGILVAAMDIATANNTVAIVISNPIAKEISSDYNISSRKTASLLDTFSCIVQGILPYGAQMLVAISAVKELGGEISAFDIIPNLYYPFLLFISSVIAIVFFSGKKKVRSNNNE